MEPDRPLVLLAVLALLLPLTGAAQVFPERFDAVADTWVDDSGSHPSDPVLRVGKRGAIRRHAEIGLDLDATVTFTNLDCNHLESIERAELVLEIVSVEGCPPAGCRLRVRAGGEPASGLVRFEDGQTGLARFDVTADVRARQAGALDVVYRLEQATSGGEARFRSADDPGGGGPRIEIVNRPIPDATTVARRSASVLGETMSYLEAGDPDSPNQFLLIHGIPSYSLMYRNVIPRLAEVGHVVAPDWIGTGGSSFPSPPTFDYRFDTQAAHLAALVNQLGLTDGGRKLMVMIHEVGGLGGFHYVTTHQDDIAGIAFYETWIDVCPDALVGSATNPPPPAGDGVCRKDTLVPFELFFLWESFIYPSEALTCATFTPLLVSPATVQDFTARELSPTLLASYVAPYTYTPDCSLIPGPLNFPRNIPVPVAGEPAASRALYDTYVAALETWTVPKLMVVGDPGGFGVVRPEQVDYARAKYPNLDAACIGRAGHFGPEDAPFNLATELLDWAGREGLLVEE
jgi:haloalkane dehalogenase